MIQHTENKSETSKREKVNRITRSESESDFARRLFRSAARIIINFTHLRNNTDSSEKTSSQFPDVLA